MKRALTVLLLLCLLPGLPGCRGRRGEERRLAAAVEETARYILAAVPEPEHASVGGEWAVLGMARSGRPAPEGWYSGWYARLEAYVREHEGSLHRRKYTEYSLAVLALTAVGADPRNVGGYDLLRPLGDYERTVWQGVNGPIWALIALDSGGYAVPDCPEAETQATREMYIDCILSQELEGGGWTLARRSPADPADADITGMALQALAPYRDREEVAAAVDRALGRLSRMQDEAGGFSAWGVPNCESAVQVLVGLCALGIPWTDSRFVKNGHTLLDNVLSFRRADGGFDHIAGGSEGDNQMTVEQAFYGLTAALRLLRGQSRLYDMTDAIPLGAASEGKEAA